MADLNKINQEYLIHRQEEKEQADCVVYDGLKEGKNRDLHEQDLSFLITQIKSLSKFIENRYITAFRNILREQNIDADKIDVIIQSIINENNQNRELLAFYLNNVSRLIEFLQSRINVAYKFQMHLQGLNQGQPKDEETFVLKFAAAVWDEYPNVTREEILNCIKRTRRLHTSEKYIKEKWLAKVDPITKNGGTRKRESKKKIEERRNKLEELLRINRF